MPESKVQALGVVCTGLSRRARESHGCYPTAAALLGQTLSAGLLLGALQKGDSRINLQIECDGPVRGLFADANSSGQVRGYIRNAKVDFPGHPGPFHSSGALGREGFISVLRTVGGETYRGSVQLQESAEDSCEIPHVLERYFARSEQVDTAIVLPVMPLDAERLGMVVGLLVQPMPDGDRAAFARIRDRMHRGRVEELIAQGATTPMALIRPLAEEQVEVIDEHPVVYHCGCSRERVLRALVAMGREEIADLWAKEGKAEATCEFCGARYLITGEELIALLEPVGIERN